MLKVIQITSEFVDIIQNIQRKSFMPLLNKYHDYHINPAMESVESIKEKIDKANTTAYIFQLDNANVGWVRVTELEDNTCKISCLCVLPEYQNKGVAQEALKIIEKNHSKALKWILDTIHEEKRNCYLYEKLGYTRTGEVTRINEDMSIVGYVKHMDNK
jgi:ribosomal protein S18 acetylase RimI-like enzyme